MKLFYTPGACALHVNIVAREAGVELVRVAVDLATKKTIEGDDFMAINPKGQIPALILETGEVLTEGIAITQFLADTSGNAKLLPEVGSLARYRVLEVANFISAELHKGFAPLFGDADETVIKVARQDLDRALTHLAQHLGERAVLIGNEFTLVDAYAFNILTWAAPTSIDLAHWPNLDTYMKRLRQRSSIQAALADEGLSEKVSAA